MEEVDNLLIHSLHQIPFKFTSSITSISSLENPELLIQLTITMLNLIKNSDIPVEIPMTLSAKYKLCMKLAELIKSLGYTSELNFNAFLYPNLKDVRNILSCLLENMPKEENEATILDETSSQIYWRKVKECIKNWASENWQAPFEGLKQMQFRNVLALYDGSDLSSDLHPAWNQYKAHRVHHKVRLGKADPFSLLTSQVHLSQSIQIKSSENDFVLKSTSKSKEAPQIAKQDLAESRLPSLSEVLERAVELNEESVGNFNLQSDYSKVEEEIMKPEEKEHTEDGEISIETGISVEPSKEPENRQEEINNLENKLQELYEEVQNSEALIATAKAELTKLSQTTKNLKTENESLKKDLEQKHKLASALNEGNTLSIETEISDLQANLARMQKEWEDYKGPILEEMKEKQSRIEKLKESYSDKIEEIKQMKSELSEIAEEAEMKEEILEMLKVEDAKGTSAMNRNAFVKKITETIDKLKTQKKGITRVIKDINGMKKSVELSRESLKRVDSGTEDLVFQDAKKNTSSKVIYKLLVDLRENYENLIRNVEDQYRIQTKISDFEIRIEAVLARNSKHDIEKLKADLEKIKSESS
jgi:DNA-binding ferritin-like protein (Dps family)